MQPLDQVIELTFSDSNVYYVIIIFRNTKKKAETLEKNNCIHSLPRVLHRLCHSLCVTLYDDWGNPSCCNFFLRRGRVYPRQHVMSSLLFFPLDLGLCLIFHVCRGFCFGGVLLFVWMCLSVCLPVCLFVRVVVATSSWVVVHRLSNN
jgi:hypothetical protein